MKELKKAARGQAFTWWDEELTKFHRNDITIAWSFLEDVGKVEKGEKASVTKNMSSIMDYLLKHMPDRYKGNVD